MSYPFQVIIFLLGPYSSFLNVSEAFSSAKIVSLNQSQKVLLCFFNLQFASLVVHEAKIHDVVYDDIGPKTARK